MSFTHTHQLGGRLSINIHDHAKNTNETVRVNNLITLSGKKLLAQLLSGDSDGIPSLHIAIGGGDAPANENNVALNQRLDKVKAKMKTIDTTIEGDDTRVVAIVEGELSSTDDMENRKLREAGIVVSIPGKTDTLYNHVTFPVITHTKNINITFTWELLF